MAPIPTMVYICTTIKTDLKYLMSLHLYSVIIIPSDYSHMPQVWKFSDRYGLSTTMASFIYNGPWVLVKSVIIVLSIKVLAGMPRKVLVNGSSCAISAG